MRYWKGEPIGSLSCFDAGGRGQAETRKNVLSGGGRRLRFWGKS